MRTNYTTRLLNVTVNHYYMLFSQQILIQSVCETVVPKLVAEDIPLLYSLLSDVFPGVKYTTAEMKRLQKEISTVCEEWHLVYDDDENGGQWVQKVWIIYGTICIS